LEYAKGRDHLARSRHRWKDDIEMNCKEVCFENVVGSCEYGNESSVSKRKGKKQRKRRTAENFMTS
jgi:hypothetical protein